MKMFNRSWEEEKPLSEFFDFLTEDMARKTPDIVFKKESRWYLIDVSVSTDVAKTEENKKNKYQNIANAINKHFNENICFFIHINFKNNYSNIYNELQKLNEIKIKEFNMELFNRCADIIEDKKKFVHNHIDKEKFDFFKKSYFEKEMIESKENKKNKNSSTELLFREELRYETIGSSADIDIDEDVFKEYNSSFQIERKVNETIESFPPEKEIVDFFGKILESDNPLYKKYKDKKLDDQQFHESRTEVWNKNDTYKKRRPKPTHHILFPLPDDIEPNLIKEELKEQKVILNFMKDFISKYSAYQPEEKTVELGFINDLFGEQLFCLTDSQEKKRNNIVFDKGDDYLTEKKSFDLLKKKIKYVFIYERKKSVSNTLLSLLNLDFEKTDIEKIEENYKIYKKEIKDLNFPVNIDLEKLSFREFQEVVYGYKIEQNSSYVYKSKMLKVSFLDMGQNFHAFFKKSGIKADYQKVETPERETVDKTQANHTSNFLQYLSMKTKHKYDFKELDFLNNEDYLGADSEKVKIQKKELIKAYLPQLKAISETNAFCYSHFAKQFYKQLMHYAQYNTPAGTFSFFNCGLTNCVIVLAGTFNNAVHDYGKPFLCIIKTKNPSLYTEFFGKIRQTKKDDDGYCYVYTNWRRLTLSKVTFMCDVFYSTLSSTMNTILSSSQVANYFFNNKIQQIYSLRVIIGYATNQKIAELLMDTRYAYMSSLSIYTNIGQLLKEKFGPPFSTSLELWIVDRLFERLKLINKKAKEDGILQSKAEMSHNVRDVNTIGGKIKLPSLWFDYDMYDVTELTDEAFLYVHTMKEPSNIFHENVKALKVIVAFQKEYDSLPEWIRYGEMRSVNDLEKFLLWETKIGCSSGIINNSVAYTLSKEKPSISKIVALLNEENIGELLSTKAVISDINRKVIVDDKPKKREINKKLKRKKMHYGGEQVLTSEELTFYVLQTETKYYNKGKPRQKVMETILDKIEENSKLLKTVHLANDFVKNDKRVIADICIKAQYGAKREFYVVNIGAKALARVTECFFKEICTNSPNEAISIPGDVKILEMQSMLDRIYFNPMTDKHKLMYVNGDCTKWSAAETMTSFIAMVYSMKKMLPPKMYSLLLSTFNSWSDKEIQVPMDIYNKVVPKEQYHTDFLKDENVLKTGKIKSTQNFLQGMFNYASSYKAVCCTNYTYYIWKKIYPNSTLMLEHMEHSDDYVLIVLYEEKTEFEKFRVLQKMMMRLHGYNDSDRKTSCQPFLMEFVSQLSFNGVMLYPQIKKSKEVNLSLPCTGYVTDMEAALSRVGECARVGCNQSFLYFFEKLHSYCVAEAYSILPGMSNNFDRKYSDLLNTPIELFGIPDVHPVFFLYCKGNGNNYRIFNYGNKNIIHFLYDSSVEQSKIEDYMSENIDYKFSLKRPNFLYEVFNKTIANLRKAINIDNTQIKKFWEENITYKFLKPREINNLKIWIKCMYYNKTFLEAYSKTSRPMMTMRLSKFVKSKIIKDVLKISDYTGNISRVRKNALTIKEYYEKTISDYSSYKWVQTPEKIIQIKKIITKCDPTYSAMYSILSSLNIVGVRKEKERTIQIAIKTPIKLKTISIQNEPSVLLQYIYDRENFVNDKRIMISKVSMEKDLEEIKNKIPSFFLENRNPMNVLSVYNDLMINKEKRIVMFGFTRHVNTLPESVFETITYNFLPGHILQLTHNNIIDIVDPFTNKIIYSKGNRLTTDYFRQSCENICLIFVYLKYYCNFSMAETIEYLNLIKFEIRTGSGLTENLDYIEVLKKLDNFYIGNFEYNLEDKKIIGYLRAVLIGEYDVLDELVSSIYSFSYKYIIKDMMVGKKFLGETLVQFTYFNTTCRAYYEEKTNLKPLLIVQKHYDSISTILYNIAIKMTLGLSDEEFEKTLNKPRFDTMCLSDIKNHEKFFKNNDIIAVVVDKGEFRETLKINKLTKETKFLPFFITKTPSNRTGDLHFGVNKARPNIDIENLAVYMGKSKLYTLPFWKCKQHPNIISPKKNVIIQNIYFEELCKNGLLEKFIKGKIDRYTYLEKHVPMTAAEFSYTVKNEISRYKIYDLDWTSIIKTQSVYLKEVLEFEPTIKETYERKFLTTINLKGEVSKKEVILGEELFIVNDFLGKKIQKEENIDDILKKTALEMDFEDDFLIDDEPSVPIMMDEIDEDFPIVQPTYIGKEMVNLQSANIPYTDIFVEKPKRKHVKNKEGVGHMLSRLKNQKPLYLKIMMNDKDIPTIPLYMNIMNMVIELNVLKKYFENSEKLKQEERYCVCFKLYKLLCETFIILGDSEIAYSSKERKVQLLRKFEIEELSDKQLDQCKKSKRYFGERENSVYIEINYEQALKIYQNEITEGGVIKIESTVGLYYDSVFAVLRKKSFEIKKLKYSDLDFE